MHTTFRICTVLALLALSACSQPMYDEAVMVEEPVIVEAPSTVLERKNSCGTTGIDDGIGGTGCPTPLE